MYSKILIALDGSEYARRGGRIALDLARNIGATLLACHVYGAELHNQRFRDMEPGLSDRYQGTPFLNELRHTHRSLITDGLRSLSMGYMEAYLADARNAGVQVREINVEGRNYVKLLEVARQEGADLVVLGAYGTGKLEDGNLGSTVTRVLRHAECDVLVVRNTPAPGSCVLVGVDGSDCAETAARKAVVWSRVLQSPLHLIAAYDPDFHTQLFKSMACSVPPERMETIGLKRQEELHDQIIDDGLRTLYSGFVEKAVRLAGRLGATATSELVRGKAYRALVDQTETKNACMTVVGRFGHHREKDSWIGSNAEALVRLAHGNVLVCMSEQNTAAKSDKETPAFEWDPEAQTRLMRIPSPARTMAKSVVENKLKERGESRVTLENFLDIAQQLGMGARPGVIPKPD